MRFVLWTQSNGDLAMDLRGMTHEESARVVRALAEACEEKAGVMMSSSEDVRMTREREIRLEALKMHLERVRHANPCCGNVGTHGENGREFCSTCGQEQ